MKASDFSLMNIKRLWLRRLVMIPTVPAAVVLLAAWAIVSIVVETGRGMWIGFMEIAAFVREESVDIGKLVAGCWRTP